LLGEFEDRLSKWEELLQSGDFDITDVDSDEQLDHVVTKFRDETIPTLIEKGVSALMALQEGEDEEPFEEDEDNEDLSFLESSEEEGLSFEDTEDELSSQVDIFTKTHYPELTHEFVSDEDFKTFSEVFLAKSRLYKNIEYAEKVFGNSTQEAKRIAEELVREMEYGTKYPPNVEQEGDPDEIAGLIDELCDSIASGNNDSEE